MTGLAHPFRDNQDRPAFSSRGSTAETLLAAWKQVEDQGREPVQWRLSKRLARRLAKEEHAFPFRDDLPMRLFGMPAVVEDAPDGFGIVVRDLDKAV